LNNQGERKKRLTKKARAKRLAPKNRSKVRSRDSAVGARREASHESKEGEPKLWGRATKKKHTTRMRPQSAPASGRGGKSWSRANRKQPKAVKSGTAKEKSGSQLTVLKWRVEPEVFKKLNDVFGNLKPRMDGPLLESAEWDNLRALADKFLGGGRWLPNPNIGSGSECGVSWNMFYELNNDVWDSDSLTDCKIHIKYPNARHSVVGFELYVRSRVVVKYGELEYRVVVDGDASAQPVQFFQQASDAVGRAAGLVGRYFGYGKSIFVLDDRTLSKAMVPIPEKIKYGHPDEKRRYIDQVSRSGRVDVNLTQLKPTLLDRVGLTDIGKRVYGLVPVPRVLVDKLYVRVAGRVRDDRLLRDLMRYAEIMVKESHLVPNGMKGMVSAKLAFLALCYGNSMEAAMYRSLVPGCLSINNVAKQAWNGDPWYWYRRAGYMSTLLMGYYAVSRKRELQEYISKTVPTALTLQVKFNKFFHYAGWGLGKFVKVIASMALTISGAFLSSVPGNLSLARSEISEILLVAAEESLKRIHPAMSLLLPIVEGYDKGLRYLPTALMHIFAGRLSLPLGVCTHYMFNSVIGDPAIDTQVDKLMDKCVDEESLRVNEPVDPHNEIIMPSGCPLHGHLPCKEPKESIHFIAFGVEGVEVEVSRTCLCNERAAVMSRVTSRHTDPNPVWCSWWHQARRMPKVILPDYVQWLQHLPTRAKGQVMNSNICAPTHKDLVMKAFVKREKRISKVGTVRTKKSFAPRLIQGRSVSVKVATGPFTWAYGKALMRVYGLDGYFMYAGGRSAEEIGAFKDRISWQFRETACEWFAVDCKRWDRSVGPTPLRLLSREYASVGAPRECLLALADRGGVRRGVTQGGIKFKRVGQVSSGDGDTSGGNSRLHLILLEQCCCAAIVSGDDALVFTDNIENVLDHYRQGDFTPIVNTKEVDFCSSLFYPTPEGSVMGPKIGRVLGKTFHSMHRSSNGDYMPWLRGVCLSMKHTCTYVPILRVLVPRLLELSGEGKVLRDHGHQYKSMAVQSHDVCEETWEFMYERYGLGESDVLAIETKLRTVELGRISYPALLDIVRRDL